MGGGGEGGGAKVSTSSVLKYRSYGDEPFCPLEVFKKPGPNLYRKCYKLPGDPKPLVTSQSPQKVSIEITLHQKLQKRK